MVHNSTLPVPAATGGKVWAFHVCVITLLAVVQVLLSKKESKESPH